MDCGITLCTTATSLCLILTLHSCDITTVSENLKAYLHGECNCLVRFALLKTSASYKNQCLQVPYNQHPFDGTDIKAKEKGCIGWSLGAVPYRKGSCGETFSPAMPQCNVESEMKF